MNAAQAAPGAGVRNSRPVRGFLRRSMKAHLTGATCFPPRIACTATHVGGGKRARLREVQQPARPRPQLHAGGHGERPGGGSTGMVCNLVDLDGFVQSEILERFDHPEPEHDCRSSRSWCRPPRTSANVIYEHFAARVPLCSSGKSEAGRDHDEFLRIRRRGELRP